MRDEGNPFHPSSLIPYPFLMSYIALYRKYRSQSFGELMGQDHVTRTLQNAIRSGRIAHAYLFHGARGCGKTSTARLVARALNCVAQEGPTPEPCGVCRLCVSIREGSCMDVIEMDAASETGIDDVREKIIENVQYAPVEARYKIFIIDEVHDLSAKAFDALLKTLEEPPAHVVFILATTEKHKVPITIRSRCQDYQFKRGSLQDLASAVQRVLDSEEYTAEPEAVQAIARAAEGSWRDALSLLEQVLAYSDKHVTAEVVHRAVGTVGSEMLERAMETIARGDLGEVQTLAGEMVDTGTDIRQLLTALAAYIRELMLIASGALQTAQQEMGAERFALLRPQAALFAPSDLLAMSGIIAAAERELRFSNQHRWILERTLLSLTPSLMGVGFGAVSQSVAGSAGKSAATMTPLPLRPTEPITQASDYLSPQSPTTQRPNAVPNVVPKPPVSMPVNFDPVTPITEEEAESGFSPSPPLPLAPSLGVSASPPPPRVEEEPQSDDRFAAGVTLEVVIRAWTRILKAFRQASPAGIGFLEKAEPVALQGNTIILLFADSFSRDRIQSKEKGREAVEKAINSTLQTTGYKIRGVLKEEWGEQGNSGGSGVPSAPKPTAPAPSGNGTEFSSTLMEVEETVAPTVTRIADFETVNNLPVSSPPLVVREETRPLEPSPKPADTQMLDEVLTMFGGQVVGAMPRTQKPIP